MGEDQIRKDEYIEAVAELYNDAKKSKVVGNKELVDRAVELTKFLFFKNGIGNEERPMSLNNVIFMDLMKTFKTTSTSYKEHKNNVKFSLTAELVFRELKEILYTNNKTASRIADFSKYLQADKNLKKEDGSKPDLFTINKSEYDDNGLQQEIQRLLLTLSVRGYITLLLVLATIKEPQPAINFTLVKHKD